MKRKRSAKQDVFLITLHVAERERRVFLEIDFTVYQDRFAAGALTFLTAMGHGNALAESCIQYCFVLFNLNFDANRLKAYIVDLFRAHQPFVPTLDLS